MNQSLRAEASPVRRSAVDTQARRDARASHAESFRGEVSKLKTAKALNQDRLEQRYQADYRVAFASALSSTLPRHFAALNEDPTETKNKRAGLLRLGVSTDRAPDPTELCKKYIAWLDSENIPHDQRLLPAVVLVRGQEPSLEYKLVVPGIDPWPKDAGFRLYDARYETVTNLPYAVVFEAIKHNRYPLLDDMHDVFHFLSFATKHGYAAGLVAGVRAMKQPEYSNERMTSQDVRLAYMVELLTLADPKQREPLREFLLFPKRAGADARLADYESYFAGLDKKTTLAHARKLATSWDGFLANYGAATVSSWEKGVGVSGPWKKSVLFGRVDDRQVLRFFAGAQEPSIETSIPESFALWSSMLKRLIHLEGLSRSAFRRVIDQDPVLVRQFCTPDGRLNAGYRQTVEQLIRTHLARMEYAAWQTANDFQLDRWVSDLLKPKVDANSPTARLVRELMPHSLLAAACRPSRATTERRTD